MIPFGQLFDKKLTNGFFSNPLMNGSNIYFVAKINKVRYDLNRCQLSEGNHLSICLKQKGMPDFFTQKSIFSLSREAQSLLTIINSYDEFSFDELFSLELDFKNSTPQLLKIKVNYVGNSAQSTYFTINPYEICEFSKIRISPEIIYVGQSKQVLNRFRKHSTILKAASSLNDDEELFLYFVTFKIGLGSEEGQVSPSSNLFNLTQNIDRKNKSYWSLITILERILIFFFQPSLNELHTKTPIHLDNFINKLLIKEGVSGILLGLGIAGNFQNFWSPKQKIKGDFASFNFKTPQKGFQSDIDEQIVNFN